MSPNYHLINNSLVTNLETEQMGRRDDSQSTSSDAGNADFEDTEDVLVLSNEIQNQHVGDAAPGISTPVRPILDLNMHPLDLNMLPTEEELDDEEYTDHTAMHVLEIQNPNPHVGDHADAAPGISTPVGPILDLNMLPTEEEDDGQHTNHIAVHVLENNLPSLQEEVPMTQRALDSQLQLLYRLTSYFQQIGGVDSSRLSEETIMRHIQLRYYTPTTTSGNEEPYICVICQAEYEADESLGGLRCGHEYHVQCIKKWLQHNNNCPICKATAVVHEYVFL